MNASLYGNAIRGAMLALPLFFAFGAQAQVDDPDLGVPDSKTLPGTACTTVEQSQSFTRTGPTLFNIESTAENVLCPFTIDLVEAKNFGLASVRVRVIDNSANTSVVCKITSYTDAGVQVATMQRKTADGQISPAAVLLTFGAIATAKNGPVVMSCNLPGDPGGKRSGVVSYTYQEGIPAQ